MVVEGGAYTECICISMTGIDRSVILTKILAYFLFLFSRYDFSEPQSGKDVCDRIISPMKGAIRRYCNEAITF